ncbi:MAG: FecR domain-containing protein, partial [Deltaproteobacteria bacterium]|nr:FecR domain-containing protein [Deltaproteobacteria bacterium]
ATFVLVSVGVDKNIKSRNINVKMTLGKIWANVSKLFANRGRFSLSTQTAIAGVRGTIYRMNVNKDKSVVVKVYQGEVGVSSAGKRKADNQTAPTDKPAKIVKPHPVPGPHPVSLKEWTHIIKSMQQIIVRPDGTVTKPFRFSLEEDSNDWVRWNRMRDEKLGIQKR